MTALLVFLPLIVVALMVGCGLFVIGARAGDRLGDALVGAAEPDSSGRVISFTVHNPARQPVLIGASVRRRTLRAWMEAGQFVSVPRRTLRDTLLAGQHTEVCAIPARERQTVRVPVSASSRRRAELVVAIGEPDRLRVVRQAVVLGPPARHGRSAALRRRAQRPSVVPARSGL